MNEYRQWLKEKGYCINCGKEKAWNGRLKCAECLEKGKEQSERTRSELSKEQRRRYLKRKRELCIAFGVCRECLKRPAKVGQKCIECHVKEINRNNNKRKNVPRNLRVELGLCYFCGEAALPGMRTCEKHYKIVSENLKKWNRDNSNHYWRKYDRAGVERNHWYKEKKQLE